MKKEYKILIVFFFVIFLSFSMTGCGNRNNTTKAKQTISNTKNLDSKSDQTTDNKKHASIIVDETLIPTGGVIGKPLTIPKANALDLDDTTDISTSVLVTVAGYNNGVERSWPIYRKSAVKDNTFTPKNYYDWSITYSVTGSDGVTVEKKYTFSLSQDTTKPVLTVDSLTDILCEAGEAIVLPPAKAMDDGNDISNNIKVKLYDENGTLLETLRTSGKQYSLSVPAGKYKVLYTCEDNASNAADPVEIMVEVKTIPAGSELIDTKNFIVGNNVRFADDELQVGFVSSESALSYTSSATLKTDKIGLNDIVAMTVLFDEYPTQGGEGFYSFGYYASKNSDSLVANGFEGSWPTAFFVRVFQTQVGIFPLDGEASSVINCNLRDGNLHNIYLQTTKTGETWDASDASVTFAMYIDVKPGEAVDRTNYIAVTVTRETEKVSDRMFESYWNGQPGWLFFSTYQESFDDIADDTMHVKSLKVFKTNELGNRELPTINLSDEFDSVYESGVAINLPEVEFINAKTKNITVCRGDQKIADINEEQKTYTFNEPGVYKIVYSATNENNINIKKEFNITAYQNGTSYTVDYPSTLVSSPKAGSGAQFEMHSAQTTNYNPYKLFSGSGNGVILSTKIKVKGYDDGTYLGLQIAGNAPCNNWMNSSGIYINLCNGYILIGIGNKEFKYAIAQSDKIINTNGNFVTSESGINILEFCFAYRITYDGNDASGLSGIGFECWYGRDFEEMTKIEFKPIEGMLSLKKSTKVCSNPYKPYLSAELINELGITESTYGQLAGVNFCFAQGGQVWQNTLAGCSEYHLMNAEPNQPFYFELQKPISNVFGVDDEFTLPIVLKNESTTYEVYYMDSTKVSVTTDTLKMNKPGKYELVYSVTDDKGRNQKFNWNFEIISKVNEVDMPTNIVSNPEVLVSTATNVISGKNGASKPVNILSGIGNKKYLYISITENEYNEEELSTYGIQLTGTTPCDGWLGSGDGLFIVVQSGCILLTADKSNDNRCLCFARDVFTDKYLDNGKLSYDLVVGLEYVTNNNKLTNILVEVYIKAKNETKYTKLEWCSYLGFNTQDEELEIINDPFKANLTANILNILEKRGISNIKEQSAGVYFAYGHGNSEYITISNISIKDDKPQTN